MLKSGQHWNDFRLTAKLVSKKTIRFTPAGQQILECQLMHFGTVVEAGIEREVTLNLLAIVMGSEVQTLEFIAVGETRNFQGFMAHQNIRRQALVFHITQIFN